MKNKLRECEGQLVYFKHNTKHVVVVDGRVYELFGYQWQECFGIDPRTGNPRVIVHEIHPSAEDIRGMSVVKMDPTILTALCDVLRRGPLDGDGYGTIQIGLVNCDVRLLKSEKPEETKIV